MYFSPDNAISMTTAFLYGTGIVLTGVGFMLTHHTYFFGVQHLEMKMKAALGSLIYRKVAISNTPGKRAFAV